MKNESNYEWKIKRFKDLKTTELYEIMKARAEVFIVEQKCIYQDNDDRDKYAWHLFLEKDGEVIAYLRILDKGIVYNEVAIGRVLTLKPYRKKGYAHEMIEKAILFVENELKEDSIRLLAQTYIQKFYEQHGFVSASDISYTDGKEHIEMVRKCRENVA